MITTHFIISIVAGLLFAGFSWWKGRSPFLWGGAAFLLIGVVSPPLAEWVARMEGLQYTPGSYQVLAYGAMAFVLSFGLVGQKKQK